VQCDAERLPFAAGYFDCVTVGFGLRNMTRKDAALEEMVRVLKPGGRLLVLEFSKVWKPLEPAMTCTRSGCCPGWEDASREIPPPTLPGRVDPQAPDQATLARCSSGQGCPKWRYSIWAAA